MRAGPTHDTLGLPSPQCTIRETEAQADDMNPSWGFSQGHGGAVGDTQSLAEQAQPPPPPWPFSRQ